MRTLLALPALALMLCAATVAEAVLVTHTSDFNNSNLSAPLPNQGDSGSVLGGTKVGTFTVNSNNPNNTIPSGDSVTFTSTPAKFFRGTETPGPNDPSIAGFVTFVGQGLNIFAGQAFHQPISMSIQLTAADVTEFRLSVVDLETAASLVFTGLSGGTLSATNTLTFAGNTVNGTADNAYQGDVVISFASAVTNPTITLTYNPAFSMDQTHFSGLSYTTLAAIPEPMSFVWFASAFGLVQYGRRPRMDATLAD